MTTDHCANPGACWVHGLTDDVIADEIRASHDRIARRPHQLDTEEIQTNG